MELGVTVKKVHRAVSYTQNTVFEKYITMNSNKRSNTKSKFQKEYYKLKNNSLYGKTVENLRKIYNLRLCNTPAKLVTYASKALFKRSIRIAENLIAIILSKESVCLDRPMYIGQTVLDLSKLRMYQIHYKDLQKYRDKFQCELNIMASDTDSFFLECKNVSLSEHLLPAMMDDCLLDTSNYPKSHSLYSKKFKAKIGIVTDESKSHGYKEWVFLRPKCYSLLHEDGSNRKKAKGAQKDVVKRKLTHESYLHVFENDGQIYEKQRRIGSQNHQLYTYENTKKVLSCNDAKRAWVEQNNSYAYCHWRLENEPPTKRIKDNHPQNH